VTVERALVREVNLQIRELTRGLTGTAWYVCECASGRCLTAVALTDEQFEEILGQPDCYLVASGHACRGVELVAQRQGFFVVRQPADSRQAHATSRA
jgi:hypothetical protein